MCDHVGIVACTKRADVQLIQLADLGEELLRAGAQPGVVPRRPGPIKLKVVHILQT